MALSGKFLSVYILIGASAIFNPWSSYLLKKLGGETLSPMSGRG